MARTSTRRTAAAKKPQAAPLQETVSGPRPFVTDIEWELKGRGALHGIGRHVALIGDNGAGKTTILQAIELAVAGGATLSGRGWRKAVGDLVTLSPGGTANVRAAAKHSDGAESTFEIGLRTHKHRNGPDTTSYEAEHRAAHADPLVGRLVGEALSSPDAARRFLLRAVGGAVTDEDVVVRLPESVQDRYRQALHDPAVKAAGTPAARLVAAQEFATKRINEARNRATEAQVVIDKGTEGLPPQPLKAVVIEAQEKARQLSDELRSVIVALGRAGLWGLPAGATAQPGEDVNAVAAIAQRWRAENSTAAAAMHGAEAALLQLRREEPLPAAGLEALQHAQALADVHAATNRTTCALCTAPVNPAGMAMRGAQVRILIEARREAAERRTAWQAAFRAADLALETATQRRDTLLAVVPAVKQYAALRPQYEAAKAAAKKLGEDDAAWAGWRAAQPLVEEAKKDEEAWVALVTACKTAVKDALGATLDTWIESVQRFLPEKDRFGIVLEEDSREVCRYGFWRCPDCHGRGAVLQPVAAGDGTVLQAQPSATPCATCAGKGYGTPEDVLHSDGALSDAEWRRAFDAMVAAWTASRPGTAILIVPDRDVSPTTRRSELEALQHFDGQVFVTMTSPPAGKKLPAWDYVYVRDDGTPDHQPAAAAESKPRKKATDTAAGQTSLLPAAPDEAAQAESLRLLGYDAVQVARMTPATRENLVLLGIRTSEVSVLRDGSFVRISEERSAEPDVLDAIDLGVGATEAQDALAGI